MKMAYIEWLDASGNVGTESLKACQLRDDFLVKTCGILVCKTAKHISIAQDLFSPREAPYRCTEHIPRRYIKRLEIINLPDEEGVK